MSASMSGQEFYQSLQQNKVGGGAVAIEGMVKLDEHGKGVVLFSPGTGCSGWVPIPVDLIERVEQLHTAQCRDHQHPFVRLFLKVGAENPLAALVSALSGQQHAAGHQQPNSSPQPMAGPSVFATRPGCYANCYWPCIYGGGSHFVCASYCNSLCSWGW